MVLCTAQYEPMHGATGCPVLTELWCYALPSTNNAIVLRAVQYHCATRCPVLIAIAICAAQCYGATGCPVLTALWCYERLRASEYWAARSTIALLVLRQIWCYGQPSTKSAMVVRAAQY
eukprot:3591792-Rhodomonas_salina.1